MIFIQDEEKSVTACGIQILSNSCLSIAFFVLSFLFCVTILIHP